MYRTRGANTVGQSDSIHAGMYMLPIFHVDVHEARSMENHPIRRELTAVFPLVYNQSTKWAHIMSWLDIVPAGRSYQARLY